MPSLEGQAPPDDLESLMIERFHLLRKRDLRKVILSATMTRDISKLQDLKLRKPKLVVLQSDRDLKRHDPEIGSPAPEVESGEQFELPPKLQEIAVQIKDEQNKPLYLIKILEELETATRPPQKLPTSNSNSCDSSDSYSASSASISSSPSSSIVTSSAISDSPPANHLHRSSLKTAHGCLIFTHSTSSAHRLSHLLSILAPRQASIAATLTKSSVKSSKKILFKFREGKIRTIISTDRASRGLDIPDLACVVNYDMPPSMNSYIHRVGRTARAGKAGTATTLVGWSEGRWFWNEIGRGQRIQRGGRKIARKTVQEEGWTDGQAKGYADALRKLGEETQGEPT